MNSKKSLFVNLTDSAIDVVKCHINEKLKEFKIVFLIHPISFQYFSIEKLGYNLNYR